MASGHMIFLLFVLLIWINEEKCIPINSAYKRPSFCEDIKNEEPSSFLWSINKRPSSFFFGTIHVPYTSVWQYISKKIKRAFETSDYIYFELDLRDRNTISALANCQMLPQGETLSNILPLDIYQRLKKHLEYVKRRISSWTSNLTERQLYEDYFSNAIMNNWEYKRPIWLVLMVNSLTESDIKSGETPVLDLYLAQEAEKLKKRIGAVESVDEQCVPLNKLNISQVLFALNQTLNLQEATKLTGSNLSQKTDELVRRYNCGDLNTLAFSQDMTQMPVLANISMTSQEKNAANDIELYFREELIYKRNKKIGERIVELLQDHPEQKFFFAFGAGHFLGNNTVLDFVRKGGFEISSVSTSEAIDG